ncbi:MAG TPA: YSC84-related protein [Candidatus Paceibacterota bacterium]|nr:hypothetical protein [Verrucomicrobiota bacterium]HOX04006.1 YSC84-related protein [Verrucomicrobiota bacterium]HRZ46900.1 YSC84-related protein [Candidatus Paceibacterota bacterium]HRZ92134.1 YSC84-related protein [Candidatus Paceibacterota bacterium]
MTNRLLPQAWGIVLACAVAATAAAADKASDLTRDVQDTIALFKKTDEGLSRFFESSAGFAVFPRVGKGGLGIGGAHGKGQVFEKGNLVGEASLTQVTIGFQLGGQVYAEVIFFETAEAFNSFKESKFALSAQASAVAAASGAAAHAKYQLGVAVFTIARGGLMYEASVGGQKFKFKPR